MQISNANIIPYHGPESRPRALTPIRESFPSDDASPRNQPPPKPREAPDMNLLERIQRSADLQRLAYERHPGARARQAISAYAAMKDMEKKEYVRAVMGVDEFA